MTLLDEILPLRNSEADATWRGRAAGVERHKLPSGGSIWYRKSNHAYYSGYNEKTGRCSGRLLTSSAIGRPFDFQPDGLMRWAARTNCGGVAILATEAMSSDPTEWPAGLSFLESEKTIWQALVDRKLTYADLREQRAKEGTNVHERVLEALALGLPLPSFDELSDEERGYARAITNWWGTRKPRTIECEQVVYSETYGYAGRFDLLALIPDCEQVWLVDLKTSGYISLAHHVQLRSYDVAAVESGFDPSERQVILQVTPEGEWHEYDCLADEEMMVHSLSVYRDAATLRKLIKEQVAA